jgi:hypothetical protein
MSRNTSPQKSSECRKVSLYINQFRNTYVVKEPADVDEYVTNVFNVTSGRWEVRSANKHT